MTTAALGAAETPRISLRVSTTDESDVAEVGTAPESAAVPHGAGSNRQPQRLSTQND